MRTLAGKEKIEELMRRFGHAASSESRVYFTGGATAIPLSWRESNVDVDISFASDNDQLLRAVPDIKEELQLNV